MVNLKTIWEILKETFREWSQDKASRLAAALAYYTIFSLAPLLIIVIAVAGAVFGHVAVQGKIVAQIQGFVGENAAHLIETMIKNVSQRGSGLFATVIAIITVLVGATGVFSQLQDALNTIWEVVPDPSRGILNLVMARLLSFLMILAMGLLLMLTFVVSASLTAIQGYIEGYLGGFLPSYFNFIQVANMVISFGVTVFLFAIIYKVLPDAQITWRSVWVGALATAVLFSIGKFLIGLYLANSSISSTYGAAGSLIIILVWVYYSAQIVLLGAEFTQVYAKKTGTGILPADHALHLVRETENHPEITDDEGAALSQTPKTGLKNE